MATYKFRAKAINGSSVTGTLNTDGRNAAFSQLLARRLVVLNIEEAKAAAAAGAGTSAWTLPFRRQKVRSDSLIFFTYQLAAMLSAFTPLSAVVKPGIFNITHEPSSIADSRSGSDGRAVSTVSSTPPRTVACPL